MFSSATISEHTYRFWTSKSAIYIPINDIKIIKNTNIKNITPVQKSDTKPT